jgi:hypothetical protein
MNRYEAPMKDLQDIVESGKKVMQPHFTVDLPYIQKVTIRDPLVQKLKENSAVLSIE